MNLGQEVGLIAVFSGHTYPGVCLSFCSSGRAKWSASFLSFGFRTDSAGKPSVYFSGYLLFALCISGFSLRGESL